MANRVMRKYFVLPASWCVSRARNFAGCNLSRREPVGLSCKLLVLLATLFGGTALAEELPDPTQPPASINAPVATPGALASQPTGLQSIIRGKKRRAAIIDGEMVELGGRHGEAKLIEVNEANVVLLGAQGRQVLSLFPDVKITPKHVRVQGQSTGKKARASQHKNTPLTHGEMK